MTNAVPHPEYQVSIHRQLDRARAHRDRAVRGMIVGLFVLGAGMIVSTLITVLFLPEDNFSFTYFGLLAVTASAGMLTASAYHPTRIHLRCPHCAEKIDPGEHWECGHCAAVEHFYISWPKRLFSPMQPTLAFDRCRHCEQTPYAMICPHCSNDIVIDVDAYNTGGREDFGYAGTTRGLTEFRGNPLSLPLFIGLAFLPIALASFLAAWYVGELGV